MIIKCEWITCKWNSADKEDHYHGANGKCKCKEGVYLSSETECSSCKFDLDNLKCKNFVSKKYDEKIKERL